MTSRWERMMVSLAWTMFLLMLGVLIFEHCAGIECATVLDG